MIGKEACGVWNESDRNGGSGDILKEKDENKIGGMDLVPLPQWMMEMKNNVGCIHLNK